MFFGDGYFNHRDHRVTGWATLDAVAPAAGNPHYFPEHSREGLAVHQVRAVYLSGTLEPNCWVDIAATLERKIDALFCHASQLVETGDWFRDFLRERAEDAGAAAGVQLRRALPQAHLPLADRVDPVARRGRDAVRRAGSGGATRPWPAARAPRRCRRRPRR